MENSILYPQMGRVGLFGGILTGIGRLQIASKYL